jgi:hypothetical protein
MDLLNGCALAEPVDRDSVWAPNSTYLHTPRLSSEVYQTVIVFPPRA